jgi:hypothetical protein
MGANKPFEDIEATLLATKSALEAKQSAARVNGRLGGRPRKIEHA